ncbi:hypothetical protein K439DRAFT_393789 [Ramaria rubella]|nr:hypothetical protein K439DRAFT_393789 [Ramaria rubella]
MLIKYNGDVGTGANADQKKFRYLTKILSIIVLVLVHQHEERGVDFQQKPFFRFFFMICTPSRLACIQLTSFCWLQFVIRSIL